MANRQIQSVKQERDSHQDTTTSVASTTGTRKTDQSSVKKLDRDGKQNKFKRETRTRQPSGHHDVSRINHRDTYNRPLECKEPRPGRQAEQIQSLNQGDSHQDTATSITSTTGTQTGTQPQNRTLEYIGETRPTHRSAPDWEIHRNADRHTTGTPTETLTGTTQTPTGTRPGHRPAQRPKPYKPLAPSP